MPVVCPPQEEQQAITRFLKAQDHLFRKFIRNKRRLIELLKEQKQNVINQAVTRGIDPNVKLKPSGVEWIGDIPEHWISRKFKHCAKFFSGGTPSKGNEGYWRGDIPWVSPKDMKTDRIYDAEDHITEEAVNSSATSIIDVGSLLLVVRSGILRRTIPIALVQRRVAFNQDIKAILPNRKLILPEYLHATIIGCEKRLLEIWSKVGATVESLEYEYFANSYLPLPPIEEQQAILDHIQEKSVEIDQAITRAQREIELMREYRTRLISDVVTGQVDVRGIDVPEVAEDELLVLDEDTGESDEVMDVELEAEVEQ
jgi:type I restriction enzyme S subunit